MASEDSNAAFRWPRLGLDDKNFRLLRFLFGEGRHTTIHCELEAASHSELRGHYIACSYVWGPDSPTKNIVVNGKPFTIRKNLFDFLRSLIAQGNGNKRFWVDAICIRQTSHIERQHQVSIMHHIFADAAAVYSWLGPSKSRSRLFDIAGDWSFGLAQNRKNYGLPNQEENIQIAERQIINRRRFEEIKNNAKDTVEELLSLSRSPYWSRMWICPEFIVNPRVRIFWGSSSVEYDNFQTYFDCFESITHLPKLPDAFRSMIKTRIDRHSWRKNYGNPQTLEHYFDIFGHKSCRRPHDKIFALLSIVCHTDRQSHRASIIDYGLSPHELLRRLIVSYDMETPIRFIKNFTRHFELNMASLASDHATKLEAEIHYSQRVSLALSEHSQDFEILDRKRVQNSATQPLEEVELSIRKHHNNNIEHYNAVTAFVLPEGDFLGDLRLFKAGRIDDRHFQHHIFLVARKEYSKSTRSANHIVSGLGIYSTVIDRSEKNRWKKLAIRKYLRKVALENLKRRFNWATLATALRSFSEASRICAQATAAGAGKLGFRLETPYSRLLDLAAEVPGDLGPESSDFDGGWAWGFNRVPEAGHCVAGESRSC